MARKELLLMLCELRVRTFWNKAFADDIFAPYSAHFPPPRVELRCTF